MSDDARNETTGLTDNQRFLEVVRIMGTADDPADLAAAVSKAYTRTPVAEPGVDALVEVLWGHASTRDACRAVLASDWLDAVKAEAGRAALRDAADAMTGVRAIPWAEGSKVASNWLRARADQIGGE